MKSNYKWPYYHNGSKMYVIRTPKNTNGFKISPVSGTGILSGVEAVHLFPKTLEAHIDIKAGKAKRHLQSYEYNFNSFPIVPGSTEFVNISGAYNIVPWTMQSGMSIYTKTSGAHLKIQADISGTIGIFGLFASR